jgi:hypothetical protein
MQIYLVGEGLVIEWLKITSVATLALNKVFLSMPEGSPLPCVTLVRVGGGPIGTGNIAQDQSRISFSVWGKHRDQAMAITDALVGEIESLGLDGGYENDTSILESASILSVRFFPDGKTARYTVDALFNSITKQS